MHVLSLPLLTFSQHQNIGQKFKLPSNDKFSKTHFFFEKNPCHYSKQHQTHPNQGKNTRAARKLHSLITRSFRDSCERFKEGWTAPRSSDEPKETKEKTGIDKRLVQAHQHLQLRGGICVFQVRLLPTMNWSREGRVRKAKKGSLSGLIILIIHVSRDRVNRATDQTNFYRPARIRSSIRHRPRRC